MSFVIAGSPAEPALGRAGKTIFQAIDEFSPHTRVMQGYFVFCILQTPPNAAIP
jgi:hypothetical protein